MYAGGSYVVVCDTADGGQGVIGPFGSEAEADGYRVDACADPDFGLEGARVLPLAPPPTA